MVARIALRAALFALYGLRLRKVSIYLQRWLAGESGAARRPLPHFSSPWEVEQYAQARFRYRVDRLHGLPADWTSEPEVFQARLEDDTTGDGDCDDYHAWAAACLERVAGVGPVYMLSAGWRWGGHTTAVFRWADQWWLMDYTITQLDTLADAPKRIAASRGKRLVWWVMEDRAFRLVRSL